MKISSRRRDYHYYLHKLFGYIRGLYYFQGRAHALLKYSFFFFLFPSPLGRKPTQSCARAVKSVYIAVTLFSKNTRAIFRRIVTVFRPFYFLLMSKFFDHFLSRCCPHTARFLFFFLYFPKTKKKKKIKLNIQ